MSDKLESGIVDAVANANFKNVGEAGAFYAMISMGDAVASQRRMGAIADTATGQLLKQYNEMDASQALALVKANTGFDRGSQSHDLGKVISELSGSLANAQIMTKLAQSTNPQTGA